MSPGNHQRKVRESRDPTLTAEQLRAMHDRTDALGKEVLGRMYEAMLATKPFTLRDGTTCQVQPFYPPEVNDDGELKFGFDVLLGDGTQLEFTVRHTGWGKSLVEEPATNPPKQGRGR